MLRRHRKAPHGALVAGACALAIAVAVPVAVASAGDTAGSAKETLATYIVQTAGAPAATYAGGTAGLRATRTAGRRLDTRTPEFRGYDAHLRGQHRDILRSAGIAAKQPVYDYTTALNGFAVTMTAAQAVAVARTPGVLKVWRNKIETVTLSQPATGEPSGPPQGARGTARRAPAVRAAVVAPRKAGPADADPEAGAGTIVGLIDSGFMPEHPSFAPLPEPRPDAAAIAAKWHGSCDPGAEAIKVTCNNKVIGARYYRSPEIPLVAPDHDSPRDYFGHGTSTAALAAGNKVPAVYWGADAGTISGTAPGARIAVYKAVWERPDFAGNGTLSSADVIAAINQAVADGVDVLSYSITWRHGIIEAEADAWLNAAEAGVFVSAIAGNSGPGGTVANAMPWVTTVAGATTDFGTDRTVTLGNGATYAGKGTGAALPATAMVDAATAAASGATASDAALCKPGTLDPAAVTGKIVLCTRGVNLRQAKAQVVKDAGGVGMVLGDPWNLLDPLFYVVPTAHVDAAALAAIKAYVAEGAGTASLSGTYVARAPQMYPYSSAGPALTGGGDLLKPDIMAPGDHVVVASAPGKRGTSLFDYGSGTSYAAPWIAGWAARLKAAHPTWSTAAIRSALMTTATQTDNSGQPIQRGDQPATPQDFGSGHAVPAKVFDPGLVYDSTPAEWRGWECAIGVPVVLAGVDFCATAPKTDPSGLNYPSIAIGDLFGKQTITRTVTNVGTKPSYYRAEVEAPAGVQVDVKPRALSIQPGHSATFTVKLRRLTAAFGKDAFGALTWRDSRGHVVRSPIAVRPIAVAAPLLVTSAAATGSTALPVRTGYAGRLLARPVGPVAGAVKNLPLRTDGGPFFNSAAPAADDRTAAFDVTVAPGTQLFRVATYAEDLPVGTDVDLYAYRKGSDGTLTLAVQDATDSATEKVDLSEPGEYRVFVSLYTVAAGTAAVVKPVTFDLPGQATGLAAAPANQRATLAGSGTVTASWRGLTPGTRYAGGVVFGDGADDLTRTLLLINP